MLSITLQRPTLFTTLDGHCHRWGRQFTTIWHNVAISHRTELIKKSSYDRERHAAYLRQLSFLSKSKQWKQARQSNSYTHMNYTISRCWSEAKGIGANVSRGFPWRHVDVTSRWRHVAVPRRRTGDAWDCTAGRRRWQARPRFPGPPRRVDDVSPWWRHEIASREATKVERSRSKGEWDDVRCRRRSRWPARCTSTRSAGRRSAAN